MKRGHFCFGEKGTFLLCVDILPIHVDSVRGTSVASMVVARGFTNPNVGRAWLPRQVEQESTSLPHGVRHVGDPALPEILR